MMVNVFNTLHQSHLKYSIAKEIPVVFHNGSNYDNHFIIKELTKELENLIVQKKKLIKKTFQFQ